MNQPVVMELKKVQRNVTVAWKKYAWIFIIWLFYNNGFIHMKSDFINVSSLQAQNAMKMICLT